MRKRQISKDNVKAQTALLDTRKKEYDLTLKELEDLNEMYVEFSYVGESFDRVSYFNDSISQYNYEHQHPNTGTKRNVMRILPRMISRTQ